MTRFLVCACCGNGTRGSQWWNRDTGYGCCERCFLDAVAKQGREEAERLYGLAGIHHSVSGESEAVAV